MIRYFVFAACLLASVSTFAVEGFPTDTKKFNHYIGFQVNELLKQIINLNNSNTAVDNPYIVTYSINMLKNNWGLHAGFGFNYNKKIDTESQINRETRVNDLSWRVGIIKRFKISNRFEVGTALDFIASRNIDKTVTVTVTANGSQKDSTVTTVTSKATGIGGGPQVSLAFHITDHLLVGTEASLYFFSEKQKKNILNVNTTIDVFNNNDKTITTSNLNTGTDTDDFTINLPVAIFLIVKF